MICEAVGGRSKERVRMSTGVGAVAPVVAAPICLSKEGVVQCLRGDSVSTILAAKIRKNVRN